MNIGRTTKNAAPEGPLKYCGQELQPKQGAEAVAGATERLEVLLGGGVLVGEAKN